jgi:hypothetical protein
MIGVFAHGTVHGVVAARHVSDRFSARYCRSLLGTVSNAALAGLDGTGEFLCPASLRDDKLPPFVQDALDLLGYIDDLLGRNDLVVPLDISLVHLRVVERVLGPAIRFEVADAGSMHDSALSSQGTYRREIRVHGHEYESVVGSFAENVSGAIHPVDSQRIYSAVGRVTSVVKLHDAANVVWFSGRLRNEIDCI